MLRTALLALLVSALVACQSDASGETTVATVNSSCPMMGKAVSPKGGTTEFMGQTVGFCCGGCADDFNDLDDAGKTAALAKVGTKIGG